MLWKSLGIACSILLQNFLSLPPPSAISESFVMSRSKRHLEEVGRRGNRLKYHKIFSKGTKTTELADFAHLAQETYSLHADRNLPPTLVSNTDLSGCRVAQSEKRILHRKMSAVIRPVSMDMPPVRVF
jgi:hypothetical protein